MNVIKVFSSDYEGTIPEIVDRIKRGEILILPTDTVYGLICDATNEKAVERVFEIKKRDKAKPLSVFVKDIKMAEQYAFIDFEQRDFIERNWPGAVTIILKSKPGLSSLVYKENTIGLRQSASNLVARVIDEFSKPLAQTSANISGEGALTEIGKVLDQFKNSDIQPDVVIDMGDLPENRPSKVINYSENKIKTIRE